MLAGPDAAQALALDAKALSGLKREAHANPAQALAKAAGQFEAMFLQMVLKQMRETLPRDGPLDSDAMRTYTSMFDQQIALALMVVAGGGVILAAAASNTILQTVVSDDLRGRVAGFYTLAFLGVAPLGNLAAGALAQYAGAPTTFLVNGLACAAAGTWFLRQLPALRAAIRPVYVKLGLVPADE